MFHQLERDCSVEIILKYLNAEKWIRSDITVIFHFWSDLTLLKIANEMNYTLL